MSKFASTLLSVKNTSARFPVTTALIMLNIVYVLFCMPFIKELCTDDLSPFLIYPCCAILLSATVTITLEGFRIKNLLKVLINVVVIIIGWLAAYFWCECRPWDWLIINHIDTIKYLSEISLFFVVLFCLPFLKDNNDRAYVNYVKSSLWYGLKSLIIFGGCWFLICCGAVLFISKGSFIIFAIRSFAVLYSIGCFYFIAQFKPTSEIYDNLTVKPSQIRRTIGCYILVPIAIIGVLAYSIHGIIGLCTGNYLETTLIVLFVALFACCVAVEHIIYDDIEGNKIASIYSRWIWGLLLIPATIIAIGLVLRIIEYKTLFRFVLGILFVIWSVSILVFLYITKGKRIKWALMSFGIVALLTSLWYANSTNIYYLLKQREVLEIMQSSDSFDADKFTYQEFVI